jgi:hypothetical protein
LPDIGGEGQEGKTFDITAIVDNSETKYDLYWQCRHLEAAIHAHAIANDGNHGATKHTFGTTAYIALSGTATIAKIRVGVKPVVLVGDSQTVTGYGTALRSPYRLGKIANYLTKDRITINHAEGGLTFANCYSTVYNGTAGSADGIDLRGLGCTWFFGGPGVNDIAAATTASDTDAKETVLELMDVYSTFLESLISTGESVILVGLPPYSHSDADQYEAKAVRWLNRALMGLALAIRVPFYNPWPDMVQAGTEGAEIPTFSTGYDESANPGLHYDDATGAVYALQNGIVPAYENATIDLRDAWT